MSSGHTKQERGQIEEQLIPEMRGTGKGYQRMLEALPLRIAVTGIRGKSGLVKMVDDELRSRGYSTYAKQTGTNPLSWRNGHPFPIDRRGRRVVIDETLWELKAFFPMDVAIVENQAIGEYTMRMFNTRVVRPHYILLTNIRHDHQGDIHPKLHGLAKAFARSVNPGAIVICGEQKPEVLAIMQPLVEARGATFVSTRVPDNEYVPGLESISLLDELLKRIDGRGLSPAEFDEKLDGFRQFFHWWPSRFDGVKWFHGAEINDIDSSRAILDYLQRTDEDSPPRVSFVAYLRGDRRDRTAAFIQFMKDQFNRDVVDKLYVSGDQVDHFVSKLRPWKERVVKWGNDPATAADLAKRVAAEAESGRVMTIINAVPPFPKAFVAELKSPTYKGWGT